MQFSHFPPFKNFPSKHREQVKVCSASLQDRHPSNDSVHFWHFEFFKKYEVLHFWHFPDSGHVLQPSPQSAELTALAKAAVIRNSNSRFFLVFFIFDFLKF
jgi:hypothetical protein